MADNQEELPFDQLLKNYDDEIAKKEIEKREKITKALNSGDADTILKASQYYQQMVNRDKSNAKSLLVDTWQLNSGLGYQDRESKLSYGMLRGMSHTPVIRSIIDTRKEQVASFAQPQPDRFSTGFLIRRKGKQDEEPTDKDKREIDRLTEFILHSGTDGNAWHADDFENFLRKFTEDSVSLDQGVFENVFTRGGELVEFFATDGTTYRIADSFDDDKGKTKNTRKINGYYPSYVQLDIHGKIWAEFYPWELCFGVRNPQTNLRRNGYGYSELEDLIQTVTSLLNADLYNANYFKQGSNPKGLLKVQGLNQNRVEEFKNQWQSEVTGVTNCLSGETYIYTQEYGGSNIKDIVGNKKEEEITIWTGTKWEEGLAYKTGLKKKCKTKLHNGLTITTSPEHKFRVIGEEGDPVWKEQKDLVKGDFVLTNKQNASTNYNPRFNGKEVGEDLFELMGWLIGDGWIGQDLPKKKRLNLFYHHSKEQDICDYHLDVLNKYGINAYKQENYYKDKEKIKQQKGFKDVADFTLKTHIADFKFHQFILHELGFTSSADGKTIPNIFYTLEESKKAAFLRGFFSADGSVFFKGKPQITIQDDLLRWQTRILLNSIGIRTDLSDKRKRTKSNKLGGKLHSGGLIVKDKQVYYDKIGFIQDYKNDYKKETNFHINSIPYSTLNKYLTGVREKAQEFKYGAEEAILSDNDRKEINGVLSKSKKHNCSYHRFRRWMNEAEVDIPGWLENYHIDAVEEIERSDEEEFMYDISVYDDQHEFVGNGMILHNSHKLPVIDAESMDFISTQLSNKDMEFSDYQKYLIKLSCAIFKISPNEIGFEVDDATQKLSDSSNEAELEFSKDKGLKPLLRFIQKNINKYIISQLNPEFEFVFVGLDSNTEAEEEERLNKATATYMTPNEVRGLKGMEPLKDEAADMILNPVFAQAKQMAMMGDPESNGAVDNMNDDAEKSEENNPLLKDLNNWIDKLNYEDAIS